MEFVGLAEGRRHGKMHCDREVQVLLVQRAVLVVLEVVVEQLVQEAVPVVPEVVVEQLLQEADLELQHTDSLDSYLGTVRDEHHSRAVRLG